MRFFRFLFSGFLAYLGISFALVMVFSLFGHADDGSAGTLDVSAIVAALAANPALLNGFLGKAIAIIISLGLGKPAETLIENLIVKYTPWWGKWALPVILATLGGIVAHLSLPTIPAAEMAQYTTLAGIATYVWHHYAPSTPTFPQINGSAPAQPTPQATAQGK